MNIDKQIIEAEEKIEKLKTRKEKKELPKMSISSRTRKVIVVLLIGFMLIVAPLLFVNRVIAANPVVVYTSPVNEGKFAETNDGDGITWIVNVSDGDSDIAKVVLMENSSGTWSVFYDSGALGGVAYHNTSGFNGNWTGSWVKYWWNISVNDGSWHNTTYSFTTAYQWGDPQMAVLDDAGTLTYPVMFKNNTGDYYLWYNRNAVNRFKTSDTGTNWSLEPTEATAWGTYYYPSSAFTYDNYPYFLFVKSDWYLYSAHWDGSSWTTSSTGIDQFVGNAWDYSSLLADCIYYNGVWSMVAGYAGTNCYLYFYTGTFPSSWTYVATLDTGYQFSTGDGRRMSLWYPSLAVFNGTLHLIHKDDGCNLAWQTYNGVSWTDKGQIGGDSLDMGGGTDIGYIQYGSSMVKDPINQQLVCAYINNAGDLVYRTTDNTTSWSDSQLILSKGAYDIRTSRIEYIDHRLVISFSYNLRGNYNIYTISSPGYSGDVSGLNYTYNRIQFPDAAPGDTFVNSTIFSMKNIDNRDIKTITWHFEDIGEIANASNIRMWTNMSGAWTSIGTTGADGNIATLDISGLMAGGGEWIPGQTIWWKAEILATGAVNEDIHTCDESIFYKVTF